MHHLGMVAVMDSIPTSGDIVKVGREMVISLFLISEGQLLSTRTLVPLVLAVSIKWTGSDRLVQKIIRCLLKVDHVNFL